MLKAEVFFGKDLRGPRRSLFGKLPLSISSLLATTTNHNNNTIITANPGTTTASLPTLIKFYKNLYDPIYNTRSESSDWLNVLLAQIICQYRDDAKTDNSLIRYVDGILNGGEKPSFLGSIKVTRLDLGEDFPVFSNARVKPIDNSGRMV
ncbi:3857_t:CDS:2 [Entrophospora sp. SA101]|nr:3857_t:CDS:2 [Entrophospora sp. SA101]CAJ0824527.1 15119_t:CDS:2 [Entrophospora sp. SA101]CAJ0883973.1 12805_t:CDS:2 [Entrophospora sp. SA101]